MTQFLTPHSQILNYLVFTRFLLEMDDLNETAKILYMILLDRARLSQKNDRWTDENGHVYLFFTIPSLADTMHKSEMTIKTALKALEEKQLIYRKRQGIGRPNRIYVKYPDALPSTDRKLSVRETGICPVVKIRRTNIKRETDGIGETAFLTAPDLTGNMNARRRKAYDLKRGRVFKRSGRAPLLFQMPYASAMQSTAWRERIPSSHTVPLSSGSIRTAGERTETAGIPGAYLTAQGQRSAGQSAAGLQLFQ